VKIKDARNSIITHLVYSNRHFKYQMAWPTLPELFLLLPYASASKHYYEAINYVISVRQLSKTGWQNSLLNKSSVSNQLRQIAGCFGSYYG
jgi:hypothetical protein